MAISIENEYAPAGISGGTDVVMTLTGAQEGDVVLVFGGHGNGEPTVDTPSGWTDVAEILSSDPLVKCFYKVMGATPDASVTCDGGGNEDDGVAYIGYLIRGADTTSPVDATATTATGGPNFPDSPSITTATNNAYVFSFGAGDTIDAAITAPTGYSTALAMQGNDVNDISVGGAYKEVVTAGAENPDAYAAWGCNTWVSMTVAIREQQAAAGNPAANVPGDLAPYCVNEIIGVDAYGVKVRSTIEFMPGTVVPGRFNNQLIYVKAGEAIASGTTVAVNASYTASVSAGGYTALYAIGSGEYGWVVIGDLQ